MEQQDLFLFLFLLIKMAKKKRYGVRGLEKIQELVAHERSQLPDQESPDFKEQQVQLFKQLAARYQQDEEIWHAVASSILAVLLKS